MLNGSPYAGRRVEAMGAGHSRSMSAFGGEDCQPATPRLGWKVHDPISSPTQTPPSAPPFGLQGSQSLRSSGAAAAHDESGPFGSRWWTMEGDESCCSCTPPVCQGAFLELNNSTYILPLPRTRLLVPNPSTSRSSFPSILTLRLSSIPRVHFRALLLSQFAEPIIQNGRTNRGIQEGCRRLQEVDQQARQRRAARYVR